MLFSPVLPVTATVPWRWASSFRAVVTALRRLPLLPSASSRRTWRTGERSPAGRTLSAEWADSGRRHGRSVAWHRRAARSRGGRQATVGRARHRRGVPGPVPGRGPVRGLTVAPEHRPG